LPSPPNDAISELNFRLTEAGVGYQFEQGQVLRVDSQFVHVEAMKPALVLLSDSRFQGPHQEFLHAHELYRAAKPSDYTTLEDAIAPSRWHFGMSLEGLLKYRLAPGEQRLGQAVVDAVRGQQAFSTASTLYGTSRNMRPVRAMTAAIHARLHPEHLK
jgi:hypothetical protein